MKIDDKAIDAMDPAAMLQLIMDLLDNGLITQEQGRDILTGDYEKKELIKKLLNS